MRADPIPDDGCKIKNKIAKEKPHLFNGSAFAERRNRFDFLL